MGYYSDVRLLTTRKGYDKLSKFVRKKVNNDIDENLLENCDFKSIHCNTVFIGWNNIKWYENDDRFKDVDAIMKGLEFLGDNNLSYHYARMGENFEDCDLLESDNDDDKLDIYSSIDRQFDDEYVKSELEREDKYYKKLQEKEKSNDLLQN